MEDGCSQYSNYGTVGTFDMLMHCTTKIVWVFTPLRTNHEPRLFCSISEVVDEDYIKTLFVSAGGTVVNFRFFQ